MLQDQMLLYKICREEQFNRSAEFCSTFEGSEQI
jgi:hypothetical protein